MSERIWKQLAEPGQSGWDFGLARVQSEAAGIYFTNAWVAETAGNPNGCLIAYQKPDKPEVIDRIVSPLFRPILELENETCETGYIFVLSTVSEMRGQGIGSFLLSFAGRYRGPCGMSLIVADNNIGARKLYGRKGNQCKSSCKMVKNGWQSEGENWLLLIKG